MLKDSNRVERAKQQTPFFPISPNRSVSTYERAISLLRDMNWFETAKSPTPFFLNSPDESV